LVKNLFEVKRTEILGVWLAQNSKHKTLPNILHTTKALFLSVLQKLDLFLSFRIELHQIEFPLTESLS